VIRLVLPLFLLAAPALAQTIPEPLSPYVSDYADLLDAATEARIEAALIAARTDPGAEIAVVTVGSRRDYGFHVSTESFATDLFNAWGIGDAARNTGILILVAIDDREMRLELGAGYPNGWDFEAETIVQRTILPAFRDERYAEGIEAGTLAAIDRIARPFAADRPAPGRSLADRFMAGNGPLWAFFAAFLAIFAFVGSMAYRNTYPKCPTCGRRKVTRQQTTLVDAAPGAPGETEETLTCRNCDYRSTRVFPVPYISDAQRRASSSSSSGFGGGSSRGGGASGRW
jgi:uncharacterized protein